MILLLQLQVKMKRQLFENSSILALRRSCTSEVVLAASSMIMTLCLASDDKETVAAKFLALFRTVSRNLPSSDPLMTQQSTPNQLHSAFATVVLPHPAGPARSKLGTSPASKNSRKVFLIFSGKIHSSIVLGRYFSTQRNSSLIISQSHIIRCQSPSTKGAISNTSLQI